MKIILEGKAQQHPTVIALLTEEALLDPKQVNLKLNAMNLMIDRIEKVDGETVVFITENHSNVLCG